MANAISIIICLYLYLYVYELNMFAAISSAAVIWWQWKITYATLKKTNRANPYKIRLAKWINTSQIRTEFSKSTFDFTRTRHLHYKFVHCHKLHEHSFCPSTLFWWRSSSLSCSFVCINYQLKLNFNTL